MDTDAKFAASDGRSRGEALVKKIYEDYAAQHEQRRPRRLGYSWIGHACERSIWYRFRWLDEPETHSGRMLRLFETGNREEPRLISDLKRIGAAVVDRSANDSRKQIHVHELDGMHFGYIDAIAYDVPFSSSNELIVEFKTHNKRSFAALQKKGVELAKPEHYAQIQGYMRAADCCEALYLAVCKDDDSLYAEFVKADHAAGQRLLDRAQRIIDLDAPPPKLSQRPDYFACKMCNAHSVCHADFEPAPSCRGCAHAEAHAMQDWFCRKHETVIGLTEQECMSLCDGLDFESVET